MNNEEKVIEEKAEYAATFAGAQAIRAAIAASPRPLPTGLGSVDRMLGGGFEYGNLYVLASAPSMGKTTLALQIVANVSAQGHDVLYLALDQDKTTLTMKGVSRCTREISENGALTTWELEEADREDCRANLSDGQLAIHEIAKVRYSAQAKRIKFVNIPLDMEDVENIVYDHVRLTGNTPFVVVDYFQYLRSSKDQRVLSHSDKDKENVMRIKALAFIQRLPLLVLSSISRASYYVTVSVESLSDAEGIESTADVVLGLQPRKYSFNDSRAGKRAMEETMKKAVRDMSLSCVKNRHGGLGEVALRYHAAYNFFEEMK